MTHPVKIQFWLDNSAGTLTEYSADVNQASLARSVEILEDTALNVNDRSILSGTKSYNLPLNGYYNVTTVSAIYANLFDAQGTTVTKTWQICVAGTDYFNGEGLPSGLEMSGAMGRQTVTWSETLEGDGSPNRTSVALS